MSEDEKRLQANPEMLKRARELLNRAPSEPQPRQLSELHVESNAPERHATAASPHHHLISTSSSPRGSKRALSTSHASSSLSMPYAVPDASDSDDSVCLDDGLGWLVAQANDSIQRGERSKRRESLQCSVADFFEVVGYERCPTHFSHGRLFNLCAYLAVLLASDEISAAVRQMP